MTSTSHNVSQLRYESRTLMAQCRSSAQQQFRHRNDITLAELALEMLFPEDQETIAIVKSLDGYRSQRAPLKEPDPAISRDLFTIEEAASSGKCSEVLLPVSFKANTNARKRVTRSEF